MMAFSRSVREDIAAVFENDPAARSYAEFFSVIPAFTPFGHIISRTGSGCTDFASWRGSYRKSHVC